MMIAKVLSLSHMYLRPQINPPLTFACKLLYVDEPVYLVNLALIKIAILVMYCRIFALRSFKIGAWVLSIATVLWSLIFIFVCIFQCTPIAKAYDPTVPGKCVNLRALFIGNAVPNIVTDAAILMMPVHQVWKLQIKLVQRISVTGVFFLGALYVFPHHRFLHLPLLYHQTSQVDFLLTNQLQRHLRLHLSPRHSSSTRPE
jgi:hypothetical protein